MPKEIGKNNNMEQPNFAKLKPISSPNFSTLKPGTFPTEVPVSVSQSFNDRLKGATLGAGINIAKNVGNALTSSEQTFGKQFSTVFDKNTQKTVTDVASQEQQGQQSVIDAIHKQTDPVKKQHLVDFLKQNYNVDYQAPIATDINPAFGATTKEVAGAALGTVLDIASLGSYGKAGVKTAKLLETAPKTIEEIANAKKALTATEKVAKVGKEVVKGAGTGYGYDVAGNLQTNKDNSFKPGAATALGGGLPLASEAVKGLGFVTKQVAKYTASGLSGVPVAAIEKAFDDPTSVQKAITVAAQDGDGATQKIYQNAVDALDNLKQARRDSYAQGLAKLENEATYTKNGQLYVKRALTDAEAKATKGYVPGTKIGVPTKLTTNGIKNVFTTTLKDFGAVGGGQGGLDFTNVALDDSHIGKLEKLQNRIYNWTDNTPTGLNRLRQVIDSYRVGGINLGSSENKFNSVITGLKQNLSSYLGERVPQVAEMNAKYQAESAVIDNIRNQLKLGSTDPNTALRKLVNVFNPKSAVYRPIVDQLGEKAGKNLMSDIAGLTMSKWTPEGLAKYFDLSGATAAAILQPHALLAAPLASPRVVGETTTALGKIAKNKTAQNIATAFVKGAKIGSKLLTRNTGLKK